MNLIRYTEVFDPKPNPMAPLSKAVPVPVVPKSKSAPTKLIYNIPRDFSNENGALVKTVWIEGTRAKTVQRSSIVKLDYFGADDHFVDKVALTVIGVESVSWTGNGNSVNHDDWLDDDPNWPVGLKPQSKRVFPGARLSDTNNRLDKVDVKVRLTVEPVSPLMIYLKPFDVDDPSASDNVVDNESEADDNRGKETHLAGLLTGADSSTGILGLNLEKQESTTEFQTSMQPGNNFRIVASIDKDHFENLVNDDRAGGGNADRQRITDTSIASGYLVFDEVRESAKYVSPTLTVWRFLHIEVDSMGPITGNSLAGEVTSVIESNDTSVIVTDKRFFENGSFNRFKGGQITVNGHVFPVVKSEAGDNMRITVNNLSRFGETVYPSIGTFYLVDDDDFNNDNNPIKTGDRNELIPMPDTSYVEANDDHSCDDGSCNMFAAAYVRPIYDLGGDSLVDTVVNIPGNNLVLGDREEELLKVYDFEHSANRNNDRFWAVYLLGAYQAQEWEDCDGYDSEKCTGGVVDRLNGDGATIFMAATREMALKKPSFKFTPAIVVAHEVGHLLNGRHEDLGMMGSIRKLEQANIYRQPLYFENLSIHAFREHLPSDIVVIGGTEDE